LLTAIAIRQLLTKYQLLPILLLPYSPQHFISIFPINIYFTKVSKLLDNIKRCMLELYQHRKGDKVMTNNEIIARLETEAFTKSLLSWDAMEKQADRSEVEWLELPFTSIVVKEKKGSFAVKISLPSVNGVRELAINIPILIVQKFLESHSVVTEVSSHSNPETSYYVNLKTQTCTCKGFEFRNRCSHLDELNLAWLKEIASDYGYTVLFKEKTFLIGEKTKLGQYHTILTIRWDAVKKGYWYKINQLFESPQSCFLGWCKKNYKQVK
jgi:hypothetical protein